MEYCNDTLELKTNIEKGFLMLGERLYTIRSQRLYKGQWASFNEYLEEFGNMSAGTASKLISIYLKFVKEFGFSEQVLLGAKGWTNLAKVAAIAKTKEEAEDWIGRATVLTSRDLDKEIRDTFNGIDSTKCEHEETEMKTLCICKNCEESWLA